MKRIVDQQFVNDDDLTFENVDLGRFLACEETIDISYELNFNETGYPRKWVGDLQCDFSNSDAKLEIHLHQTESAWEHIETLVDPIVQYNESSIN